MEHNKSRPFIVYLLMLLIIFQGVSGLIGGIGLILDPKGEALKIPISWLNNSPFNDYLIPGLILLFVLGIFPLVVFYSLFLKLRWSWFGALFIGIALIIWIIVEVIIIGYHVEPPLQAIYGSLGIVITILTITPPVQKYGKQGNNSNIIIK